MLRVLALRRKVGAHQPLTSRHWTGVSPYTSSYELAGTCVLDKQLPGGLWLRPAKCGEAFLRTYGRCFAEFLNEESPVRLRLLDVPTCFGFSTVVHGLILGAFLERWLGEIGPAKARPLLTSGTRH